MIQTTQTHIALLATRQFWAVDLWQLTFLDGTVLRYSSHALSTSWNGYTWQAGPMFDRGSTKLTKGLEADSLQIEITPRPTDQLYGIDFFTAVRNGALDGVKLSLYRAHAAHPGDPIVGAFLRFKGDVQEVESDLTIRITVKSDLAKLDMQIPRDLWEPGCSRTLYDVGCGVARAAYQTTGTAAAASSRSVIVTGEALPNGAGYFTAGEIMFTSGANAGARRSVRLQTDAQTLRLAYPLLSPVTAGDQFLIWPGCSRTWDECKTKFNNGSAFNGQPFVPSPETAL